ncbi:MAG: hypothetical protein EOP34_05240 [Rickettsiales bacterium]|nr:MAG: hypothetical protein EOP34_05240 [Rickettsiales bacterium]
MKNQNNTQNLKALIYSYKPGAKYIRFNKNILPSSCVNSSPGLPVLMDNFNFRVKSSILCNSISVGFQTKYSDVFIYNKVTKDFNVKSVYDTLDKSFELSQEEKN